MILDIFYFIAGGLLTAINAIFGAISFILPDAVPQSIEWFFSLGNYFIGVFPVGTLYQAVLVYISAYVGLYTIRMALSLFQAIPFVGKRVEIHHGKK